MGQITVSPECCLLAIYQSRHVVPNTWGSSSFEGQLNVVYPELSVSNRSTSSQSRIERVNLNLRNRVFFADAACQVRMEATLGLTFKCQLLQVAEFTAVIAAILRSVCIKRRHLFFVMLV